MFGRKVIYEDYERIIGEYGFVVFFVFGFDVEVVSLFCGFWWLGFGFC